VLVTLVSDRDKLIQMPTQSVVAASVARLAAY
jgi:hypothetical protein